eukprot:scpid93227/ scgid4672/ 
MAAAEGDDLIVEIVEDGANSLDSAIDMDEGNGDGGNWPLIVIPDTDDDDDDAHHAPPPPPPNLILHEHFTMNKVAQYAIFVSAVSWWRDAKKYKCTISACPVDKIPKTGATMRGMTEGDGETFVIPDEELGKLAERFSEKWSCTTVCNDDEDDDALNELF